MTVIAFESKAEKRKNRINELHQQRVTQYEETDALLKRMDMKLNSGVHLSEDDFIEVIRSMAKGHRISETLHDVACEDPDVKKRLDEQPQNLYECWKEAVHSGEKVLTPFVENPEQYLQ